MVNNYCRSTKTKETKMKITFETESIEEATNILNILSGATVTTPKPAAKKAAKKAAAKVETPPAEEKAPPAKEEIQEAEVLEEFTEEKVTAKARELVAASSPATLRAVLDAVIGEGVKIGAAPKEKYSTIFEAVSTKLAEINAV